MPRALAARPRKMLPPPMTMRRLDAERWTSTISQAIWSVTVGSIPKVFSPIRASPESFRRMRVVGGRRTSDERLYAPATCAVRLALADLEPDEAANAMFSLSLAIFA